MAARGHLRLSLSSLSQPQNSPSPSSPRQAQDKPKMSQDRPKMIQDRPSRGPLPLLTSKNARRLDGSGIFTKKNARRLDGSYILKGWAPILEPMLSHFGFILEPFWGPEVALERPSWHREGPKTTPRSPKAANRRHAQRIVNNNQNATFWCLWPSPCPCPGSL